MNIYSMKTQTQIIQRQDCNAFCFIHMYFRLFKLFVVHIAGTSAGIFWAFCDLTVYFFGIFFQSLCISSGRMLARICSKAFNLTSTEYICCSFFILRLQPASWCLVKLSFRVNIFLHLEHCGECLTFASFDNIRSLLFFQQRRVASGIFVVRLISFNG